MWRRFGGGLAAVFACACTADVRVVEVPASVDRVAIARAGADGLGWSAATGMFAARGEGARRAAVAADAEAVVVGWTEAALVADLGALPPDDLLAAAELRSPAPCERMLPAASWAMAVGPDGSRELDPRALPPLTATWSSTRCDDATVSTAVVCGETETLCPARRVTRDGCLYTLDFDEGCELGSISVSSPSAAACSTTEGCRATRQPDGAMLVSCDATCGVGDPSCRPDEGGRPVDCAFTAVFDAVVPAVVDAIAPLSAAGDRTPPIRPDGDVWPEAVTSGYLGRPALAGVGPAQRLVVPVHPWRLGRRCARGTERTRLAFISVDTASVVREIDGPPCLDLLAPDPLGGGGFVGTWGARTSSIGRFDADGRLLEAAGLRGVPAGGRRVELLSQPDGTLVLVYERDGGASGEVAILDPDTLAVRAHVSLPNTTPVAAAITSRGWIAIADDATDLLVWFDASLTVCVGSVNAHLILLPRLLDLGDTPVLDMIFADDTGQLVVAMNEYPAIHVFDDLCMAEVAPGEMCLEPKGRCLGGMRALPRDRGAEPIRLARWNGAYAVASAIRADDRAIDFRATLALLDLEGLSFEPGLLPLGAGIARDLVVDDRGALWVSLPWSGKIVRVVPR